jgi:hypothetical protein
MTKKIMAVVLFSGLLIINQAQAEGLSYEMSKSKLGPTTLTISADFETNGLWLGITLYTPAGKTDLPLNKTMPLEQGKTIEEMVIDPRFVNGTFEAAIYGKKLSGEECLATDEFCKKNGRLTNMISYIWGRSH